MINRLSHETYLEHQKMNKHMKTESASHPQRIEKSTALHCLEFIMKLQTTDSYY